MAKTRSASVSSEANNSGGGTILLDAEDAAVANSTQQSVANLQHSPEDAESESGPKTATGLPRPPGKNLKPGEFFDYVRSLTARDFAHLEIYVYAS